jgi:transcriptional regulator with XRE-family HTH domain
LLNTLEQPTALQYNQEKPRKPQKNRQKVSHFGNFLYLCSGGLRIMKNKFDNQENVSMLGMTIQQVRKAKGMTQEELGKRVGLPKSSISKIEKGQTHISFEDASLLMDAMGEKITIQVMGMKEPDEKKVERVRFVTIGVMWYAHSKKMAFADAYRYLLIYKGIQFLEENYAYEQTLPRQTLLDDLDKVCNRNREKLRKAV